MFGLNKIEKELTTRMQETFSSTEDRKMAIHLTAVAGAGIVAALPWGVDAWALRLAEIIMVICISSSYGEKLTKSAAKGIMLSSFAQLAGEAAAITALEAAETAKVATLATGVGPVAAYGIKSGIAVTLIETVGHLVIAYYEKSDSFGAKTCKWAEKIGFTADIARVVAVTAEYNENLNESNTDVENDKYISFTGTKEGYSGGHSESWWKKKAIEAEVNNDRSGYKYAMKRLEEAVENRVKKENKA